jgi:HD-GYP domain-containing protein (c-di-GMP phosphodiesterase class II)
VIDAFDAMVSSRPYRNGLPLEEALRRLHESSGTQFDFAVVQSFARIAESELAAVLEAVGSSASAVY